MLSTQDTSSRAKGYIIASIISMALAFLMVTTRLACRFWLSKKKLWWDDLFILLSLVLAVAYGFCTNFAMANLGWDRHIWQIPADELEGYVRFYFITKLLFISAGTCVRMALLLFYFWLVRDYSGCRMKRLLLGCMVANGALWLVAVVLTIFECVPVRASWTYPRPAGAKCLDDGIIITTIGVCVTLADLVINVLPLPIVARLKVSRRQRVEAAVLLSLGSIATVAGLIRTIYMYKAFFNGSASNSDSLPLWACVQVEIFIGLSCACLPSIKPLWIKISHHLKPKTNHLDCTERDSNLQNGNFFKCSQPRTPNDRPSDQSTLQDWTKSESDVHSFAVPTRKFSLLLPQCGDACETSFA